MDEELPKLREAIVNNGYSEDVAREVQAIIEPFVGYGLKYRSPYTVKYIEECRICWNEP